MRAKYRKWWLTQHAKYEKRAFRMFRTAIQKDVLNLPWENLQDWNYEALINLNLRPDMLWESYVKYYRKTGIEHGEKVGKQINSEAKFFTLSAFIDTYNRELISWMQINLGMQIRTVRGTLVELVVQLIRERLEAGLTMSEVTTEVQRIVNSREFYRWQSMRIARTESTRAANYGASIAGRTSGIQLQKEWIAVLDNRTRVIPEDRYDHRVMNGVRVDIGLPFDVQGEALQYPGDPNASAANTINCRCTVANIPKRDNRGRLIFTV